MGNAVIFYTHIRSRMIGYLVSIGVDRADASIITDYARDRGPHAIPGRPDMAVWWMGDCWTIARALR